MSHLLINIPPDILNFHTAVIDKGITTVNNRNRSAVRSLYKKILNGDVYVSGNLAIWLQIKINTKQTPHVIRMLHQYEVTKTVRMS